MQIKRFKQGQRFRVIVGAACFYATAGQIRSGVGDFVKCNAATQKALDALEFQRTGIWEGVPVQLNVA